MYLIRLRYDGTAYAGYQRQKNANTVGDEILRAANEVFGEVESFVGCSRTDSGVHANDYAISFSANKKLVPQTVVRALNAHLPEDIVVFDCKEVEDGFNARYNVKSKEYVYNIYNASVRSPFYCKYSLFYPHKASLETINEALSHFVGKKDFASFMAAGSKITQTERTVFSAHAEREKDLIRIYIEADGFLYNMVRIIVGTVLEICEGKKSIEDIEGIINKKDRSFAGRTAPALGLMLNRVNYG